MGLFTRSIGDPDGESDGRLCITGRWPNVTVTWNDVDVTSHLHKLSLEITSEDYPLVTLSMMPHSLEIDAECMASIEAAFRIKESRNAGS